MLAISPPEAANRIAFFGAHRLKHAPFGRWSVYIRCLRHARNTWVSVKEEEKFFDGAGVTQP